MSDEIAQIVTGSLRSCVYETLYIMPSTRASKKGARATGRAATPDPPAPKRNKTEEDQPLVVEDSAVAAAAVGEGARTSQDAILSAIHALAQKVEGKERSKANLAPPKDPRLKQEFESLAGVLEAPHGERGEWIGS